MATKRRILLPTINGIVAGSSAGAVGTLDIPIGTGFRLHQLQVVYIDGGASPQDITALFADVNIFRNSIPERTHTSLELEHLNTLNGSQYARQQVNTGAAMRQTQAIFFAEPWRKDKVDTDAMAWNVCAENGFRTLQVKFTLLAAMPATGSLVVYAWIEDLAQVFRGTTQPVKKVYRQQIGVSGTSFDVTTLDARDAYQVIALKHPSTSYINKVTLKRNNDLIMDQVNREDNVAALTNLGLTPASSVSVSTFGYDIVLDADDPMNSALFAQGQALWMQLGFAAASAGNVVALIERLGPFD